MQWPKIGALRVITMAVMRAISWALGWVIIRLTGTNARMVAVVANTVACTAFVLFLYFNLLPGEPMDFAEVAFGVVVFGIYTAWDWHRSSWKRSDAMTGKGDFCV